MNSAHGTELPQPSGPLRRSSAGLTTFVGREDDLAHLRALVGNPAVRFLTITGPGGVGKTRLAEELVVVVGSDFADGVSIVELAAVTDGSMVPAHMLRAFGDERDIAVKDIDALCDRIGDQRMLVVLDNMEQMVGAAPVIQEILLRCPALTMVLTSRMLLRVRGEHEYILEPLSTKGSADRTSPAADLLIDRARAALGNRTGHLTPDLASRIAARVDGLPLAIELAAAQMRMLSPAEVLDRLDSHTLVPRSGPQDVPARQQTMEAAVAWSIDLLTATERDLFQRLSVFAGGFDLRAGHALSGLQADDAYFETIDKLIAHSLIQRRDLDLVGTRFSILETIRAHGRDLLRQSGDETATLSAHANWFRSRAHELGPQLRADSDHQYRIWKTIEADIDNYRRGIEWFGAQNRPESAADLVSALDWFWTDSNYVVEGYCYLQSVADDSAVSADPVLNARTLCVYAMLSDHVDDAARPDLIERAITAVRATGDLTRIAELLHLACGIAINDDRLNEARSLAYQTIEEAAARDQIWFVGAGEMNLSLIETLAGDYGAARASAERGSVAFQAAGDTDNVLSALNAVAYTWLFEGAFAKAQSVYQEVLIQQSDRMDDAYYFQHVCRGIAAVSAKSGRYELAARLLGMAEADFARTRISLRKPLLDAYSAMLLDARAMVGGDRFDELVEEGRLYPKSAGIAELITLSEPPSRTDRSKRPAPFNSLSNREFEVLLHLMAGRTDPEIAAELFLSPRTVSQHVSSILNKLSVSGRSAAAAMAASAKIR